MIRPSTLNSAGVVAASIVLGGTLLVLPSSTHERSAPSMTMKVMAVEAPAVPAASAVPAADRAAALGRAKRVPASPPPATAGMVVGIDPETGELGMPTPEQMQKLSELQQHQMDHSAEGLLEVHHPDGSVSIDLQGRFQEYATVRVGPDGKRIYQCVDGAENAKHALETSAKAGGTPGTSTSKSTALEDR